MAFVAVLFSVVSSVVIGAFFRLLTPDNSLSAIGLLASLVVQAFIYGSVLRDAVGPIGYGKGCLVNLVQAAITIGVAICICFVFILAGIALPVFAQVQKKGKETTSLSHEKQIATACKLYAVKHGGMFPATLDVLVPDYLPDKSVFASPFAPTDPMGYQYTPGLMDSSPPDTILLENMFSVKMAHDRVVCHVDTSALVIKAR